MLLMITVRGWNNLAKSDRYSKGNRKRPDPVDKFIDEIMKDADIDHPMEGVTVISYIPERTRFRQKYPDTKWTGIYINPNDSGMDLAKKVHSVVKQSIKAANDDTDKKCDWEIYLTPAPKREFVIVPSFIGTSGSPTIIPPLNSVPINVTFPTRPFKAMFMDACRIVGKITQKDLRSHADRLIKSSGEKA